MKIGEIDRIKEPRRSCSRQARRQQLSDGMFLCKTGVRHCNFTLHVKQAESRCRKQFDSLDALLFLPLRPENECLRFEWNVQLDVDTLVGIISSKPSSSHRLFYTTLAVSLSLKERNLSVTHVQRRQEGGRVFGSWININPQSFSFLNLGSSQTCLKRELLGQQESWLLWTF